MPTFAEARDTIAELVTRFRLNPPANETSVRVSFINPFFEALGWDVQNRAGYAEQFKDVIHEDAVTVGTATKAPDYSFRIGGLRKFFVEAKKPSVDVKGDPHPAYQLRRYAWSAKLPLSILTDFEELAVYDCTKRPVPTDRAATARIHFWTLDQYADSLQEIWNLLAKDSVLKGSFDRFAQKARGTAQVDAEFLKEIERWRDLLAHNIANRNRRLDIARLNDAVQRIIDRIIFLRMAEDRAIEPQGALLALVNAPRIYPRFGALCEKADAKYNSGLFDFKADDWTLSLKIDDRILHDIIKGVYYPDSPYEFSVIPPEILGNVYEQFLGKVIRLTPGHQARVEEKPEVKKAGGVYYTPKYIVDYIVENTIGKLVEGKAPAQLKDFHVLDPACGSGSFLLGAYQRLLDHHLQWYIAHGPEKHPKAVHHLPASTRPSDVGAGLVPARIRVPVGAGLVPARIRVPVGAGLVPAQGLVPVRSGHPQGVPLQAAVPAAPAPTWRLTTAERKRILTTHIYGVDIDPQAVEVTKLSLLLKVLEGESADSLGRQLSLFRQRALPNLDQNIKCGNSLIGPDYFEGKLPGTIDPGELRRVNPFDWQAEFPHILGRKLPAKKRGFDAVIGNPPYVLLQDVFRDDEQLAYFRSGYAAASYKLDTYHLFIERGITLTKRDGRFAMITPANFLTNNYLAPLRRFILENSTLDHILVVDGGVFRGISVDNSILAGTSGDGSTVDFPIIRAIPEDDGLREVSRTVVSATSALAQEEVLFSGHIGRKQQDLWEHVQRAGVPLKTIAYVNFGKQLRDRKKFTRDVITVSGLQRIPPGYRPCYTGRDVSRYHLVWGKLACFNLEVARHGGCWDPTRQDPKNKLITRQIGKYPEFALDCLGYQCLNTVFMVNLYATGYDPFYVLGILNSRLLRGYWLDRFWDQRRTFPKIKGAYLEQLPIHAIDPSDPRDKTRHDRMVELVGRMLDLHKQIRGTGILPVKKAGSDHGQDARATILLQRQIDATDRQIDALVYELYGLTDKEIAIVEGDG